MTDMAEYTDPVAYQYASRWPNEVASYHPECLIKEMVDRRELSPAARDMEPEVVLNQHAAANGIERDYRHDPAEFPSPEWATNELAERNCGRCETAILPAQESITAVQHVARDLAAADLGEDRNDYDPDWYEHADHAYGPEAERHIVAHEAFRQYREHEQLRDWALSGAQATEALQRPLVPDNIEKLKARLVAPLPVQQNPRPTR